MPIRRGFVPPALVISTIALIMCAMAWGALGVVSISEPDALPIATHRYLCILLATVTLGSAMVHLAARIVRVVRDAAEGSGQGAGDGYADGYAAGLLARPEVSRLVTTRR